MKLSTLALVTGAALLAASPARAQDPWERQVAAQLDAVVEALDEEGLSPAGDPLYGTLNEGEFQDVTLELTAGSFLIIGVCDADCSDLDLVLTADGEEIDSDLEPDDTPVLVVEVEEGGTLTLRVGMPACSSGPCRYGVGVFSTDD
jgi:hypothetical protein